MKQTATLANLLKIGVMAIFLLLPFHAFFTTWLGSNFGYLDLWRIWKELLIAVMVPVVVWIVYHDPKLRRWVLSQKLVPLIALYALWHLLIGLAAFAGSRVNAIALVYALLINLRFPVFMLLCAVLAARTDIKRYWKKLLLGPAVLVIIFGLLQVTVLPVTFLQHFGYGAQTIPAVQTVDQKLQYRRIQSTLRGANPLGAYLVLIITACIGLVLTVKKNAQKNRLLTPYSLLLTPVLLTLFYTYSRSAWLGMIVSVALLAFWLLSKPKIGRWILIAGTSIALIVGGSLWLLRDNDLLQNTFFHSDETSQSSQSSNFGRARALRQGLNEAVIEPLGRGPGTAGPASFRNAQPARIAENYYIQIAQELGLIGLGLFVAINILLAQTLWRQRTDTLSLILLASLAGISLINLVSHAWTDDTLSLIWWGLAGIVLGSSLPSKPNRLLDDRQASD